MSLVCLTVEATQRRLDIVAKMPVGRARGPPVSSCAVSASGVPALLLLLQRDGDVSEIRITNNTANAPGATEYLRVDEVAELLRTTPKAVYLMIDRGRLAGVRRIGRRVLVKRSELVASIEEGCVLSPRSRR